MTIRKGEEWGRRETTPEKFVVAEDDKDAASQPPHIPFGISRGNMYSSLGQPKIPLRNSECTIVPIDALMCTVSFVDGREEVSAAFSQVSIGSWWRGRCVVASNSGFLNGMNIAPRSHPNDGEMDIVSIANTMPLKQRFIARRKAKTGTHIPHPHITVHRATTATFHQEKPQERLSIDGVAVSGWSSVSIAVEPDYWQLIL